MSGTERLWRNPYGMRTSFLIGDTVTGVAEAFLHFSGQYRSKKGFNKRCTIVLMLATVLGGSNPEGGDCRDGDRCLSAFLTGQIPGKSLVHEGSDT